MARRLAPIALAALLLAGCAGQTAQPTITTPSSAIPQVNEPVAGVEACQFDFCYEPNLAVDPLGRIFVADGSTSAVGVSTDGGVTFRQADPPPMTGPLTAIQSDVLLQVSPSGRLYYSALLLDDLGATFVLRGLQIAWSDDGATTWAGNVVLDPAASPGAPVLYPDRQWLGFGSGDTMYITYNQIPTGIWVARSDDAGATWGRWSNAVPVGLRAGAGQSGPPVVDQDGTVFVPACDAARGTTFVFRSTDGGMTFFPAPAQGGCSWFPILAIGNGTLTLAVQDGVNVIVTTSTDGGMTFGEPVVWGRQAAAAPWPLPGPDGSLVLAWHHYTDDTHAELHVSYGNSTHPTRDMQVANVTSDTPSRTPALTDFASAAWMPDGRIAVVWVDGPRAMVQVLAP